MPLTRQDAYAKNLKDAHMGLPISFPVPLRREIHVGCVGDVFYFDESGSYTWVCNAFHSDVLWPSFRCVNVTSISLHSHFIARHMVLKSKMQFRRISLLISDLPLGDTVKSRRRGWRSAHTCQVQFLRIHSIIASRADPLLE